MIYDSLYDEDVDLEVCSDPYVAVRGPRSVFHERVNIYIIMKAASYIQSYDKGMAISTSKSQTMD